MVRVRWVAPVLLLLLTLPAFAAKGKSSSQPPRDLHRVGDHWTAYTPPDPATYAADAKTHAIVAGETLWALAQQYYGNAYLWPQLWESNTWITDAHWIYPGDVLLVTGDIQAGAATSSTSSTATTETNSELAGGSMGTDADGSPTIATEAVPTSRPVPLGTEADVYCYGYIGNPNEPMPNYISSFEDVEILYQKNGVMPQSVGVGSGELVFVQGGTSTGLVAGETYMIVGRGDAIKNPRTGTPIGQHYDYLGQLRIMCADETTARGMIVKSCREILAGAHLKPMPQLPIPIARVPEVPGFCDPTESLRSGYIVDSQDWDLALGEGHLVQINLGTEDQVQPGDFFVVYRESPIAGQPRQTLGEIGILTSEGRTSTGRIVRMRRTMQVGDIVEPR